jgi:hypothetical protein
MLDMFKIENKKKLCGPNYKNLHTIKKNNWQVQSDFGEKINSKKAKGIF